MKLVFAAAMFLFGATIFQSSQRDDKRIEPYKNWKRVTEQPVDMSPRMALSCVGPRKHDLSPNPHFPKVFLVYVNKSGEKTMLSAKPSEFPVGTVIVKEKYNRSDFFGKDEGTILTPINPKKIKSLKPELLTIMTKTSRGWEYSAADGSRKLIAGDSLYCADCHASVAKSDSVYKAYGKDRWN